MNVQEYLNKVAYVGACKMDVEDAPDAYYSKFDDSYITFVGLEKDLKNFAELEITDELTHGVGFSPKDGKWYGWSHRAMYGFGIGSTCKKGDCHYVGNDEDARLEAALEFWRNDNNANVHSEGIVINDEGERFFIIKWDYLDSVPNKKLHGTIGGVKHRIEPLGRGEWTAKTMEDAKQMAIDFKNGVS